MQMKALVVLCVWVLMIGLTFYSYGYRHTLNSTEFVKPQFQNVSSMDPCWSWRSVSQWQYHIDNILNKFGKGIHIAHINITSCNAKLEQTLESNLRIVDGYPRGESKILQTLQLDDAGIYKLLRSGCQQYASSPFPVIVTAASSNHFGELQQLFMNIKLLFHTTIKIVFFDLGLNWIQQKSLKSNFNFEYRLFNVSAYPYHVRRLFTYTWKPIIIQQTLQEFSSVIWADTSIRFTSRLYQLIEIARFTSFAFIELGDWDGYAMTQPSTFEFINEEPCLFTKPSVDAGFGIYYRNPFTLKYVMRPWVSCALSVGCMALKNWQDNTKYLHSCSDHTKWVFRCHRFDQSFLNILLVRLFGQKRRSFFSNNLVPLSVSKANGPFDPDFKTRNETIIKLYP